MHSGERRFAVLRQCNSVGTTAGQWLKAVLAKAEGPVWGMTGRLRQQQGMAVQGQVAALAGSPPDDAHAPISAIHPTTVDRPKSTRAVMGAGPLAEAWVVQSRDKRPAWQGSNNPTRWVG
jgi:hypothetical protein